MSKVSEQASRCAALVAALAMFSGPAWSVACGDIVSEDFAITLPSSPATDATIARYVGAVDAAMSQADNRRQKFCLVYELARLYILTEKYKRAIDTVKSIPIDDESAIIADNPIYNILGYAHLQRSEFIDAINSFEKQMRIRAFSQMSVDDKIKVHNNSAFAYLQVGQYQNAIEQYSLAANLGSSTAQMNLGKVHSLLASLGQQTKEAPGIFTTVVARTNQASLVPQAKQVVAERLAVPESDLRVFKDRSQFFISLGAAMSYPAAVENKRRAAEADIPDAWVTPTGEWEEVTKSF